MGCGCKNAESGCGCGTKEMNWESYDKPSFKTTMMAESWGETDQATMEEFFGYDLDTSPDQRVAFMLDDDESLDLPSLEWYFQNSLNGQGDWMTVNYGKDSVEDALSRVQGRMGKANKFGYQAEEPVVQEPDWIPAGDGRAIGQQDFAINLSPLHAESFNAETLHEKGDYRIIAEEDYDVSMGGVFQERDDFDDLMELSDTHGMFTLSLQKKVMGGWETIDSVSGVVPHYGDMGDIALKELNIPESVDFNAETPKHLLTHCADCKCKLNSKNHKMDTSGSVGGVGSSNGALCDSCFVHLKKTGNFNNPVSLTQYGAESRFDKLSNEIALEYKEKGMSPEKAQEVGDATAAKIGRAKYGKTGMRNMQIKGMKADMVGNPSPMFNEDITGQDGPSADPTNQTFEAMRTLAPSSDDVNRARRDLKNSGYGDVIYDRYMVNRDGSSNKFYYTAITEKDGKYYPMGAYGRIGYLSKLFNIYGKSESPKASLGSMDAAYRQCSGKEKAKIKRGYVDYTLRMAESYRAESLSQIEGATAEATSGGLHSPSSFDISWEDGNGLSSASMPPNEIAWAEDVKASESAILGGVAVIGLFAIGLVAAMKFNPANKKTDDGSASKNAEKGCGCSKTVAKSETVKNSEYSADRINPVEVEGQNDIHNAESITQSSPYAGPQTAHRQNNRPTRNLW